MYELYCQCDKLRWAWSARKKLIRGVILGNTLPNVNDRGSVQLGDNDRTGLQRNAEGKGNL